MQESRRMLREPAQLPGATAVEWREDHACRLTHAWSSIVHGCMPLSAAPDSVHAVKTLSVAWRMRQAHSGALCAIPQFKEAGRSQRCNTGFAARAAGVSGAPSQGWQ